MDKLPGLSEEGTRWFLKEMENILAHGWGQVTLVIGDGRVMNVLPAKSFKPQGMSDVTEPTVAYRQERKLRRGE